MNVVLTVSKRCSGNWCYLLYEYWFVGEGTVTERTTIRKDDPSALFVDNCSIFCYWVKWENCLEFRLIESWPPNCRTTNISKNKHLSFSCERVRDGSFAFPFEWRTPVFARHGCHLLVRYSRGTALLSTHHLSSKQWSSRLWSRNWYRTWTKMVWRQRQNSPHISLNGLKIISKFRLIDWNCQKTEEKWSCAF